MKLLTKAINGWRSIIIIHEGILFGVLKQIIILSNQFKLTFKTTKMNVNKFIKAALIMVCISTTLPAFSNPVIPNTELNTVPPSNTREAYLLNRLAEIKKMTKQNLSRAEKKELRKEIKEIRKEIKASKNGIYLSVGAIIIIVLLLILLL